MLFAGSLQIAVTEMLTCDKRTDVGLLIDSVCIGKESTIGKEEYMSLVKYGFMWTTQ